MIPHATYRLQFRNGMDFDRAVAIVPYLKRLGVSHLYASPIFTAAGGSTHGYDVVDHNEIDPALGGRAGFDRLSAALKTAGLGLILDIVPNHMAASLENPWWRSVVEWGGDSPFRDHFDIDWSQRLTLPILGKTFEEALASAEFGLRADPGNGVLALTYFEASIPLHPSTYALALDDLDDPLAAGLAGLAAQAEADGASRLHAGIGALLSDGPAVERLDARLAERASDADVLAAIHDAQPWRLCFWKDAPRNLSYRRFFEVTGLAGVRVEDIGVFNDVHRLILDLVGDGHVDGLRVDHVDGLADPKRYLDMLRHAVGPDVFLVVEKILGRGETLPRDWPISGTTGYEFIAKLADVLTDPVGVEALDQAYSRTRGAPFDHEAEERAAKRAMVCENFETELNTLVRLAGGADDANEGRDGALREAIVETIVAFPVYRTYGDEEGLREPDLALLETIEAKARREAADLDPDAFETIGRLLRGDGPAGRTETAAVFRARFQQLTGPVMAKSIEDTLFFRCNRFIAANEVGGDPSTFDGSIEAFHASMEERLRTQPYGLLATATHDTKRGEDARARLYTLSEAPAAWAQGVARWSAMNAAAIADLPGGPAPDPDTQWMLYQALAGIWPAGAPTDVVLEGLSTRFSGFVEKALREAKRKTRWTDIDADYEDAVMAYASRLTDPGNRAFVEDFSATLAPHVHAGSSNGLVQTLLKLTAPGIPDLYQGSEGIDDSLVDPDNRRDIDFAALDERLRRPADMGLLETGTPGGPVKQHLIMRVLAYRTLHPDLFTVGAYTPLSVTGRGSDRVIAFTRTLGDEAVIGVARRFSLLENQAGETDASLELPPDLAARPYEEWLTGRHMEATRSLSVADVLGDGPVALLVARHR